METKNKIKEIAKKLGSYTIIIVMLFIGFFIGRISTQLFKSETVIVAPQIRGLNDISIAVNETNDILIIDRKNGKYEMYSDSVGFTIFRMYAGRIQQSANQNNQ